jgi:DNA-binding NtrC family response regulator
VRILRLIQEREIEKVGATGSTKVDVRIIAATHRNLATMVSEGGFREDLYYRLLVVPITVPPLRERREDIPELVQHFFLKSRAKHGRPGLSMPSTLLRQFSVYDWPGNVRQLENAVERLVLLATGDQVSSSDLPDFLRPAAVPKDRPAITLPEQGFSLEAIEKEVLLEALKKFDGNQTQAARYLGMTRRTLAYRMEKHRLRSDDIRTMKRGAS